MTKNEFWLEYVNHMDYGFMWLFISFLLYYVVFRKYIYSILDPLALHILMSASATSVVFFLFQMSLIKDYYFYSFLFTQIAFVIGFMMFKPISIKTLMYHNKSKSLTFDISSKFIYFIATFLYLASVLVTYYFSGIPLFMESRLETYSGGSGFGIFGRIIPITSIIILVIAFYNILFIEKRYYFYDKFIVLIVVINAILSGSKSEIILIFFIIFFIIFYNFRTTSDKILVITRKFNKLKWVLLMFSFFSVLIIINIQVSVRFGEDNTMNPIIVLLMRFINSGDIYYLAYPNSYLNYASDSNGFLALFTPLIGTFRLIPWEQLPDAISLQLYQRLYETNLIEGPNTRHNVFGLFYFGPYFSIIFSFILGLIISYFRNRFYFKATRSVNGMILYILIAVSVLSLEIDPVMGVSLFTSILIVFIPIYFISRIIMYNQKHKFKENNYVGN